LILLKIYQVTEWYCWSIDSKSHCDFGSRQ